MIHFTVLLIFLTAHSVTSQWYWDPFTTMTTTTIQPRCGEKEGTSFTLIVDNLYPWNYIYAVEQLVNRLSEKFPCVQRQYTLLKVKQSVISESVSETKDEYIRNLHDHYYWDYYWNNYCNQSMLYGLKRALEISPAESFILTLSSGSVIDQNNTEILADIYQLLNEKKSQVFFINYDYCAFESEEDVLRDIAIRSFGFYRKMNIFNLYEATYGFDLFLHKPLDSSVRILNVDLKSYSQYREEFDVVSSFTFLMIATNGYGNFNFTDPNGNYPHFERKLSHVTGNTYLVKFPIPGNWTLDMVCYDFCSVRISGFTGLESIGNCSSSDCDQYASCEEFEGYQECTCTAGFQGDGSICRDIDECRDYFLHKCPHYCTNTFGSFRCSCYPGFEYVENIGCVDIDECLNSTTCHPSAICTNHYGSYTCTCPGGYNGDGKHCELECQKVAMCDSDAGCDVSLESSGCFEPCYNHTIVDEQWRLSTASSDYFWYQCDYGMFGWYRFQGRTQQRIPEHCIKEYSCGTQIPLWINGTHPTVEDGTLNSTVCASWTGNCCYSTHPISIRACPGGYYVYKIQRTPFCSSAYCTEPLNANLNCSSADCAADEECVMLGEESECHCRNNDDLVNAIVTRAPANTLYPDLVCGISQIKLSYSKCMLENVGYDTSSIYLRDRTCKGFIGREDKSYVRFEIVPRSGYCGAELKVNKTHLTYVNSVYLSQKFDGVIQKNQAKVDFFCSYPLNMEVSLWTAIDPFVSSVNLSMGGIGLYSAKMALYQDVGFSRPYEGSDIWLSTESMLYIGVIVEEVQEFNLVLLMKNCYATPTSNSGHPVKYYIIKDNCPNRNDPSISVQQNGLSLHGRFSFQVFRFIGNYDQVYLHCQIKLCDTSTGSCIPKCSGMKSANLDIEKDTTMTLGPIHHRVLAPLPEPLPAQVPLSAGTGGTTSLIILILTLCLNLVIYN